MSQLMRIIEVEQKSSLKTLKSSFDYFIIPYIMKKIIITFTLLAALAGCANTHIGVNANNSGVFSSIGSSYHW